MRLWDRASQTELLNNRLRTSLFCSLFYFFFLILLVGLGTGHASASLAGEVPWMQWLVILLMMLADPNGEVSEPVM